MNLQNRIQQTARQAVNEIYNLKIDAFELQATRKDFEGDITLVVFPVVKLAKESPVAIGTKIGEYLKLHLPEIQDFNVVQGFLNLVLSDAFYKTAFYQIYNNKNFGTTEFDENSNTIMVEYSSPNTNKPLHLGHVRNDLLGYSVASILQAAGNKVYKTQIINDRGIHICKSMLAYQKFGNGETPESSGLKGDKLIGNYYVLFENEFQKEYSEFVKTEEFKQEFLKDKNKSLSDKFDNSDINDAKENNFSDDIDFSDEGLIKQFKSNFKQNYFNKYSKLGNEAQEMLQKWEAGEPEIVALWKKMNAWVYAGFDVTYKALGVDFDINYYESNTYLLGKSVVQEGLDKGVFYRKDDGSVWIDLTADGLDEKLVLRSDGTSVYITQDIGTAIQRVKDFPDITGMVYTVGNEQDYHFKVLFLILKKLGYAWAENLFHLSYGMVDLPEGKMKSREGTVVDADDLMKEMTDTAREISQELGKLEGYSDAEKEELYRIIGMGALKYFILKVDPKKRILFNPKESIDFNGNTGPFIQYTYARIRSLMRKTDFDFSNTVDINLQAKERNVIKTLLQFPETVQLAAQLHSPAIIANFVYDLVKEFNSFYQSTPILTAETQQEKIFRIQLSQKVSEVIASGFEMLGIAVPERM